MALSKPAYVWTGSSWVPLAVATTTPVTMSQTAPNSPTVGDIWLDTSTTIATTDPIVTGPAVDQTITAANATTTPLIIKGASGQTDNLLEFKNNSNNILTIINNIGNIGIGKNPNGLKPLEIYSDVNPAIRLQNSTTGTSSTDGLLIEQGGNNSIIVNYEPGNMSFYTNNINRMTIDSSGRIIMPYQPLFSGTDTRALDLTNVILNSSNCYDQIDYNVGSHFNSSTGRFTAPIDGYYEASAHVGSPGTGTVNLRIRKNGNANTGPLVEVYNQAGTGSTNNYARAIIYCSAGDYLEFEASRLTTFGGIQHKRFLIRLIG